MQIKLEVPVGASKHEVWELITDIEHAADNIAGIESVEVLEKPEQGIVGLKWRETRKFGGRTECETMWITDAVENEYYGTRAESHGAVYITRLSLKDSGSGTVLTMSFEAFAQTLLAKILSSLMTPVIKRSITKALAQDLEDIKAFVEKG